MVRQEGAGNQTVHLHKLAPAPRIHWRNERNKVIGQGRHVGRGLAVQRSLKTLDRETNHPHHHERATAGGGECHGECKRKVFFTALAEIPLRPGALAKWRVENFSSANAVLTIAHDKADNNRRIVVTQKGAQMLRQQCPNKWPKAPIFTDESGKAWNSQSWLKALKQAKQVEASISAP